MIEAMKWTSDHAEDEIKRQVREQVKNAEEQASANLQQQENELKANFKRKQIKLDKSYAEKEKTLEMAYRGSKRLMWILKAVVAVAVLLIVLAVCTNSQNKAIKKAAQLQECIDEVNTANWYLCGKDMIVYTRVEEFYIPMDRMTLRSGRAVQVPQIGEKWVEIKSQGKIGYILRSDFDEYWLISEGIICLCNAFRTGEFLNSFHLSGIQFCFFHLSEHSNIQQDFLQAVQVCQYIDIRFGQYRLKVG